MKNRIFHIFVFIVAAVATAMGQTAVGTWNQVPAFGGTPQKVVATADRLYFVSAGNLGSVEVDGGDIRSYSTTNMLSASSVADIYYNHERDFLVVIYEGGNIDLLYPDDRCYNMADIADAQLTVEKRVLDVAFHGNRMYVGTNFGMVEFDIDRRCVVWSMILDSAVESVAVIGDMLVISNQYRLYVSPVGDRHNTLSGFTYAGGCASHRMIPVSDHKAIYTNGNLDGPWELYMIELAEDYGSLRIQHLGASQVISLEPRKGGGAVAMESDKIIYLDTDGNKTTVMLPAALDGCSTGSMTGGLVASYTGPSRVWTATQSGVSLYDLGSDGTSTPTLLSGPARPDGTSTKAIGYIVKGKASGNLYVGSMGTSSIYGFYENQESHIDLGDGSGSYVEVTPKPTFWNGPYPSHNGRCYGNLGIAENPLHPGLLYIGNFWEGIYRMDLSGKLPLTAFNWLNSPMTHVVDWSCLVPALGFDPDGNLWAVQSVENSGGISVMVLPAAKTAATDIKEQDWKTVSTPNFVGDKDGRMLISERHRAVVATSMLADQVVVIDTRGTWDDTSDDRVTVRTTMTDQDGLQFVPAYPLALAEDRNGRIWVGHNTGVYEISDLSKYHDSGFSVNRLKVARNDGTNNADYLLNGQRVTSIAVDASNRKWLGTDASGLYVVAADGSSVIDHFTVENSPLPTNCIYSLYCDDESNLIYVGTAQGLMVYSSDSAPAADDYSDVYAYPNPVHPDYTGWITVTGLMDNSLVKIADSAGNVFFTGRSNGGMITWDGCDPSGQRVRTGVYFVFASEQPGGGGSGAVCKILVVN